MAQRSFQEFYDAFIVELQNQRPDLTDTEIGSMIDVLDGVFCTGLTEVSAILFDEFRKTFFKTATGTEATGGQGDVDDLENLAVDHFGEAFRRPEAVKATGTVSFTRPNTNAGNVLIPAGTVVKTTQNALGSSVRFATEIDVTMTGLSINASVIAVVAGVDGNVQPNTVNQIESTLTDSSIVVNNAASFAGGAEVQNDEQYRETIRLLLESLKGGTLAAIKAKALTVPGVEIATAVEYLVYVKEWDIDLSQVVGDYFAIPRVKLYIADSNGTASQSLINAVKEAVNSVRAAGVKVDVLAATALTQSWSASIVLNPAGLNYATLQTDTTLITDAMFSYLQDLAIGEGFSRSDAKSYILSIFGAAGTNDLTNFTTVSPTGDVAGVANQKIIPGTMDIV